MHHFGLVICTESLDIIQVNYRDQVRSTKQRHFHPVGITELAPPWDLAGKMVRFEADPRATADW